MRALIAEDETLLREGLRSLLVNAGIDVVSTVEHADHILDAVATTTPDVVITDIRMPPTHTDDGLRAAARIRDLYPDIGVIVLSQYVQRRYALELLDANPSGIGYLLKQRISDVEQFCADVAHVAAGGTALDPDVVALMVNRAVQRHGNIDNLTVRQLEVLSLIAEGRSNASIATRLGITEKAIVQHASHIYDELGLAPSPEDHRRVLAVIRYLDR